MKFLYLAPSLIFYVLAIKLQTIVSMWVLSATTFILLFIWFIVEFNQLALLSSATDGKPTETSMVTFWLWIACILGWSIGFVTAHKDVQQFLINLVTP